MERDKRQLTLTDYPLPDATQIERQVLSNAVGQAKDLPEYVSSLTKEMFSTPARAKIWEVIETMYNNGDNIDAQTIFQKIGKQLFFEEITAQPSTYMGLQHAALLRDAYTKRVAYLSALGLLDRCCDPAETENGVLSEITTLQERVQTSAPRPDETDLTEIVNEVAKDLQERKSNLASGVKDRIPTGFPNLDNILNRGFAPGQLVILAARPSVGKTAIMLNLAKSASRAGFKSAIFTLEMTKKELASRLLLSAGTMGTAQFYEGSVEWNDFEMAVKHLDNLPIAINDSANRMPEIVSRMHSLHNQGKCDIAFVDYLGLIQSNSNKPLYQVIAEQTKSFKAVAKRLGIPIIVLCQLNREVAKTDRAPQLFDLRDSGGIEQDADIVLMLEQLGEEGYPGNLNMWVRKNRQGKKDLAIELEPDRTYTSFEDRGMKK